MIRPAAGSDGRALAELEVRAWRWAYVDIFSDEDMITVGERVARWEDEPLDGAFVAEVEGRVQGVVQVAAWRDERDGEPSVGTLRGLYVEPAAQGAGLGAALHDHAVRVLCEERGFATATLWVLADNGHARGFYERRGWAPDGATDAWHGAAELRYRKDLET